MEWWQHPDVAGHVDEARAHLTELHRCRSSASATHMCDLYFRCLNRLWNGLALMQGDPARADTPAFIALLRVINPGNQPRVLRDPSVSALADLNPEIHDQSVIKRRGHRLNQPMSDALRRDATERHRKFTDAHARYLAGDNASTAGAVLKKLAEALFVVRSNIAHGEKTPYGPDLDKVRRDEQVSAVAVHVLAVIVEAVLPEA